MNKRLFFFLIVTFCYNSLHAQLKEGTVFFERKQNMHRNMPNEQLKAMMPEFNTSEHMLMFKNNTSLYKKSPVDELPEGDGIGGQRGGFTIKFNGGPSDDVIYKDLNSLEKLIGKNYFNKDYLIVDTVKNKTWKLTDETKVILGYTCRKAITTIKQAQGKMMIASVSMNGSSDTSSKKSSQEIKAKEVEIIAWFCEQINVSSGPEDYGNLPGLILEIDVDNGGTTITAIEIKKKIDKSEFVKPSKGIKLTQAEFEEVANKTMEEMQKNSGFGGGMFKIGG